MTQTRDLHTARLLLAALRRARSTARLHGPGSRLREAVLTELRLRGRQLDGAAWTVLLVGDSAWIGDHRLDGDRPGDDLVAALTGQGFAGLRPGPARGHEAWREVVDLLALLEPDASLQRVPAGGALCLLTPEDLPDPERASWRRLRTCLPLRPQGPPGRALPRELRASVDRDLRAPLAALVAREVLHDHGGGRWAGSDDEVHRVLVGLLAQTLGGRDLTGACALLDGAARHGDPELLAMLQRHAGRLADLPWLEGCLESAPAEQVAVLPALLAHLDEEVGRRLLTCPALDSHPDRELLTMGVTGTDHPGP